MTTFNQPVTFIPADHVPGPKQGEWTYNHYAALPEDGQRYEIIDGVLLMAPPSPTGWHQAALVRLIHYLFTYVEMPQLGQVFAAPFDVELGPLIVVQPDVLVLLEENKYKFTPSRIIGGPDLVIEIVSPSTATYDRFIKRSAYARAGVKEYWIVEPTAQTIELLSLEGDAYKSLGIFSGVQTLPSQVVPNFPVAVKQVFE